MYCLHETPGRCSLQSCHQWRKVLSKQDLSKRACRELSRLPSLCAHVREDGHLEAQDPRLC